MYIDLKNLKHGVQPKAFNFPSCHFCLGSNRGSYSNIMRSRVPEVRNSWGPLSNIPPFYNQFFAGAVLKVKI